VAAQTEVETAVVAMPGAMTGVAGVRLATAYAAGTTAAVMAAATAAVAAGVAAAAAA